MRINIVARPVCHIVFPSRGGHGGPPLQLLLNERLRRNCVVNDNCRGCPPWLPPFLWSKDRGIRETEAVFERDPLRHWLACFHRGLKFDLACGSNGVLSQSVRKSSDYPHTVELAVAQ